MQDGTIGQPGDHVEDDMNIRVGDETHYHLPAGSESEPTPPSTPEKAGMPTWAKYLGTAFAASGIGAGGLAGYNALTGSEEPATVVEPVTAEPIGDRWNEITVEKWVPDGAHATESK